MRKFSRFAVFMSLLAAMVPGPAQARKPTVLMIVTSAGHMANGKATGIWLEEFAVPYLLFTQAGYDVTVASPQGGQAPVDPGSAADAHAGEWTSAAPKLATTVPLSQISADRFDAVFLPGGHGTMFDLPHNPVLGNLLGTFAKQDKIIAAVCHGPAGFVGVTRADGKTLVDGKTITSFTDAEEAAVNLTEAMPFLLESELRKEGAKFIPGAKWAAHVQVDGKLITGQNPASSKAAAEAVITLLK